MKSLFKIFIIATCCSVLSGCLVTSVVGGVVGTAVDAVDTVTPDITD
ncbi:hypothetical protein ACQP31_07370 [Actinobacillus pleuropneumoniae]